MVQKQKIESNAERQIQEISRDYARSTREFLGWLEDNVINNPLASMYEKYCAIELYLILKPNLDRFCSGAKLKGEKVD